MKNWEWAVIGVIFIICLASLIALKSADGADYTSPRTVAIQVGDTLWAIAKEHYPNTDPREVVWHIRRLNPDLGPGALKPGQTILIP